MKLRCLSFSSSSNIHNAHKNRNANCVSNAGWNVRCDRSLLQTEKRIGREEVSGCRLKAKMTTAVEERTFLVCVLTCGIDANVALNHWRAWRAEQTLSWWRRAHVSFISIFLSSSTRWEVQGKRSKEIACEYRECCKDWTGSDTESQWTVWRPTLLYSRNMQQLWSHVPLKMNWFLKMIYIGTQESVGHFLGGTVKYL